MARDQKALSQSATRIYPLVVARARGAVVEDVDGNRYLDFTAGIRAGQSVIRLVPPLMITKRDADKALEILDAVLTEVEGRG